jgi:glycosyltransferase 2 family protein
MTIPHIEAQLITGSNRIRRILIVSIRLLVTAALVWALAARVDLGRTTEVMSQASALLLAATIVPLAAANVVVALRWHVILSAEAPSPGPRTLLKIVFVGLFFSQMLPSSVGGDAVRAWRCRKLGIGLGPAIRSILLDRACGYLVLIALYAATLPRLLHVLPEDRQRVSVVVALGIGLCGLLVLMLLDRLPRSILRLRAIAPLAELSRESRRLLTQPRRGGIVLASSLLTIGFTILGFKLAADAVGNPLSLASWAIIVPPVSLIQLLPISLAGWGVREVVLVVALASFGVPAETALATSVLFGLCQMVISLPGGLIWLADWDIARPHSAARARRAGQLPIGDSRRV